MGNQFPEADPASTTFRPNNQPLQVFFTPRTVAVIGASEAAASSGRMALWNLVSSPFGGTVFPVSHERSNILGIRAYPEIAAIKEPIELAVIATPAPTIPGIVDECASVGVKGIVILSGGFRECGQEGATLEQQVLEKARRGGIRVIGPNCLGIMCPLTGLNATSAVRTARPGNVAFLSQSGALGTAVLDWSLREMVGFSCFVSIGSMVDVGWGDLIDYLGDDPRTRSILIYMESIGDAGAFLSAAREVALTKPIIVIKAGRTPAAAKAAASHTGSTTGTDEIFDAAFRRVGVLRVNYISDLFSMAEVLAKQPRPKGPRLTIITNAGGPGVLATDALLMSGGELADLSPESLESLGASLPPDWSRGNPIDIVGGASPEQYRKAVEIAAKDPNSDGLLVILTPQAATGCTETADQIKSLASIPGKPILASWMGGADVAAGQAILNGADIPTFPYPDTAARAFAYMWKYSYNLRGIYETPLALDPLESVLDRTGAERILEEIRGAGRTLMTEFESKKILAAYGIPVVETVPAENEAEAVKAARSLGYPVVLKVASHEVVHKTEVGGVHLGLADAAAVRRAYAAIENSVKSRGIRHFEGVTVQRFVQSDGIEFILGSSMDPQFGPVLLFGAGGRTAELQQDRSLALPPLNTTLARRMMEQTRIYAAIRKSSRWESLDLEALEKVLVSFSLLVEQRPIKEMDINPLLLARNTLLALDARIVLHDPDISLDLLPQPPIRPYPSQHVGSFAMKDGATVTIRPIRPDDEPMMVRLHETLSERSVYFRYFHPLRLNQRIAHARLTRMCCIDYAREMALVAVRKGDGEAPREILGVGRLIKLRGTNDAEFAILVGDRWQGLGLGTELLRRLLQFGRDEKLSRIVGDVLSENRDMLRVCEKLGFTRQYSMQVGDVKAEFQL